MMFDTSLMVECTGSAWFARIGRCRKSAPMTHRQAEVENGMTRETAERRKADVLKRRHVDVSFAREDG
jgi:hypothetical protein